MFGVLEGWRSGAMENPTLHFSITPFWYHSCFAKIPLRVQEVEANRRSAPLSRVSDKHRCAIRRLSECHALTHPAKVCGDE
jgi:hypothetical protein